MSWEANSWACKQRMKLPQEQLVLIVLGNCADPDGVAFSKWPGREHWWKYLAKLTRLSKSSLFRHINTIVALGLATRETMVLADGAKRPTINLDLRAAFDIESEEDRYELAAHSRQSHGETGHEEDTEEAETVSDTNVLHDQNDATKSQSHHETVPTSGNEPDAAIPAHGTDPFPIVGTHIDSSISCSKESPPTPSGGFARDDLWDQFVRAWGEPIPKMALARSAWDHVETARRPEVIAAAKGYWAWLKAHPKPPAAQSAQSFIRDSVGWAQWLRYTPGEGASAMISSAHPMQSPEAKAIIAAYEIAGLLQFVRSIMIRNGAVNYLKPVTPRLLALVEAGPKDSWPVLTRQQAAAWESFLRETVTVQVRKHLKADDRAPWPWPPSAEGKIYATGPPPAELSDQELADLK